jgi:hypothetical protein
MVEKQENTMKRFIHIMILTGLLAGSLKAGVFMKQKQHTDATEMMGQTQPAQDFVQEIWLTEQGFRSDGQGKGIIFKAESGEMIMLDHNQKRFTRMALGKNMMADMMGDADQEGAEAMKNMMQTMMQMTIQVNATGEKKKIKSWSCQKYTMQITMAMGSVQSEIWATEDIQIDPALYKNFSSSMFGMIPGMQQSLDQIQKETQKIKGVQVMTASTIQMMGQPVRSTTELLEVKNGKAPAGLLKIPAGYQEQKMGHGFE